MLLKVGDELIVLDTSIWLCNDKSDEMINMISKKMIDFSQRKSIAMSWDRLIVRDDFVNELTKKERDLSIEYSENCKILNKYKNTEIFFSVEEVQYIINGNSFFECYPGESKVEKKYSIKRINNIITELKQENPQNFIKYKIPGVVGTSSIYTQRIVVDYLLGNLNRLVTKTEKRNSMYTRVEEMTLTREKFKKYIDNTFANGYENREILMDYITNIEVKMKNCIEESLKYMNKIFNFNSSENNKLRLVSEELSNLNINSTDELKEFKTKLFNKIELFSMKSNLKDLENFFESVLQSKSNKKDVETQVELFVKVRYFNDLKREYPKTERAVQREIEKEYGVKLCLEEGSDDQIILRRLVDEIRLVTQVIDKDIKACINTIVSNSFVLYQFFKEKIRVINHIEYLDKQCFEVYNGEIFAPDPIGRTYRSIERFL